MISNVLTITDSAGNDTTSGTVGTQTKLAKISVTDSAGNAVSSIKVYSVTSQSVTLTASAIANVNSILATVSDDSSKTTITALGDYEIAFGGTTEKAVVSGAAIIAGAADEHDGSTVKTGLYIDLGEGLSGVYTVTITVGDLSYSKKVTAGDITWTAPGGVTGTNSYTHTFVAIN
jgi:hypothetical protein